MKKTRRWMKWIVETDVDQVPTPWARTGRRDRFKAATKSRARAA